MNSAKSFARDIVAKQPRRLRFSSTIHSALKPAHFNISRIIEQQELVHQNCIARNLPKIASTLPEIVSTHKRRSSLIQILSPLESRRNSISAELPVIKDATRRIHLLAEAAALKSQILELKQEQEETTKYFEKLVSALPNDTHHHAPPIETEIGRLGSLQEKAVVKSHVEIAESLDILDLRAGAKTTGHAWYYLKGMGVQLELALMSYAIQMAVSRGWTLVKPPDVVKTEIALACGFHPRDDAGEQIYQLANGHDAGDGSLCLAGTAEIPLAAMNTDKVFREDELPVKYVGLGTAYRMEAGSRGRESKGLFRVHQFTKVELFAWTGQEQSDAMLEEILELQKDIVAGLGLHARILDMPPHELGNAASRKYDIEAWMYGRQGWGEITSASNCTDYQSRRLNTRYRPSLHEAKLQFTHTLNGTAMAVPRIIIAILESGLQEDGSVEIPQVLRKYIGVDSIQPQ
jgi:seryl-tRNA synthetase